MSDLQCPATFLVAGPAAWPDPGALQEAGVAAVYAAPARAEPAAALAARLSATATPIEGGPGRPLLAVLDELADLHRGSTCLVLAGALEPPLRADDEVVRVRIDADGRAVERP